MPTAMDEIAPEVIANTTFHRRPGAPPRTLARVRQHSKYIAYYSSARFANPLAIGSPITLEDPEQGLFESRVAGVGPTNERDRTVDLYLHGCFVKNDQLKPPQHIHFISDFKNLTFVTRLLFYIRTFIMWLGGLFLPMPQTYLQRRLLPLTQMERVPHIARALPPAIRLVNSSERRASLPAAPPPSPKQ